MDNQTKGNNQNGSILPVLILGTAVGLAVGFLFAPRPGKEVRQLLKEKAVAAKQKAADFARKASQTS